MNTKAYSIFAKLAGIPEDIDPINWEEVAPTEKEKHYQRISELSAGRNARFTTDMDELERYVHSDDVTILMNVAGNPALTEEMQMYLINKVKEDPEKYWDLVIEHLALNKSLTLAAAKAIIIEII